MSRLRWRGWPARRRRPAPFRPSPGEVLDKLDTEGSPDGVAAALEQAGRTGRHVSFACPVAQHARAETGVRVFVGPADWSSHHEGDRATAHPTPPNVAAFITAFDKGSYPSLHSECEHAPEVTF